MSDTNESPKPGTPEHDAAMIALAESRTAAPADNSSDVKEGQEGDAPEGDKPANEETPTSFEKPEGVPDKYWNADTGVVDYSSWNKEMEYLSKKAAGNKPDEKPEGESDKGEGDKPEDKPQVTPVQMEKFSQEYYEKGELSDASYDDLAKLGLSREYVDAFIEGQNAIAESNRAAALSGIGGEENFAAMAGWMSTNLEAKELQAYNQAVESGNPVTVKAAIDSMYAKYTESTGARGVGTIEGDGSPDNNSSGYNSRKEFSDAINDPRYGKDPHYTQQVERKMGQTPESVFQAG